MHFYTMIASIRLATCLLASVVFVVFAWTPRASAQADFLTDLLMSEAQERQLAEQEHPKVLEQFGGVYHDPELQSYVGSIANFLGRVSRRPDIEYRLTILNSPVVNAFALPAGYLYVTRGLLALADSEAELAGVIAHEIGHVTGRHTAERYRNTVLAQGLVGLFGAAVEDSQLSGIANLFEPGAAMFVQGFSRDHEHEADFLGVETMSRAGYDPRAMASFLAKLGAHTRLEARAAGRASAGDRFNLFATHPRTVDRVERTIQAAGAARVHDPMIAKDLYLGKLDGMLYGDDPEQGFVRGTAFVHPKLRFRFDVPDGFAILNGQRQVVAQHQDGSVIKFDRRAIGSAGSPEDYLTRVWAKDTDLTALERFEVNGLRAATGTLRLEQNGNPIDLRLVVIETAVNTIDRFQFAAPAAGREALVDRYLQTVSSYRHLNDREVSDARPFELLIHQMRAGDSIAGLASTLPFVTLGEDRLRVLNGLGPEDEPAVGSFIKLVGVRPR